MKATLALLLIPSLLMAQIAGVTMGGIVAAPVVQTVGSFQNFSTGTNGTALSDGVLNGSKIGGGSWAQSPGGLNSAYGAWFITNATPVALRQPLRVGSQVFTTTGSNFIRYWLTNDAPEEAAGFQTPGGSGGTFRQLTTRLVARFCVTNDTGTGINLDHFPTDGNPYGIIQHQTGAGDFRLRAHGQTLNGAAVTLTPCQWYHLEFTRRDTAGQFTLSIWTLDGSLLGTSTATMDSTSGNAWWVRLQANYLNLSYTATGFVEVGGVAFSWE